VDSAPRHRPATIKRGLGQGYEVNSARLFEQEDLNAALEGHARGLDEEIENTPEEHLLQADENEWVRALVARYAVQTPELRRRDWWMDTPEEIRVDVSGDWNRAILDPSRSVYVPGYRVTIHIPFSGEKDVFKFRPSTRTTTFQVASVGDGELVQTIEYTADGPRDVRAEAEGLLDHVEQYLEWARMDIEAFNAALEHRTRTAIQRRRERVRHNYKRLAETGIPMLRPEDAPRTYIADVIVRRPSPASPPTSPSQAIALEPTLGDATFEHILEVIRATAEGMERSPKTYVGIGEEDRRQILVAALNSHYRGQITAEAFNAGGRTDILVRHPEGRNLFIGECKFWSGTKGFTDAINQLFGYTAWRDTKLAIIMFVREKDLSAVVEKARVALEHHPQLVERREAANETELRATVSWPGDVRRHADLNIFFIHTPE
jgi:hypothetical protein